MKSFRCVICKKYVKEHGNNPAPVKSKGKCCNNCNINYVLPVRMQQPKKEKDI